MTKKTVWLYSQENTCPLCGTRFPSEKVLSRKIAPRAIGEGLRNIYDENADHPDPILYSITVCPKCLFSAFEADFARATINSAGFKNASSESRSVLAALSLLPGHFLEPRTVLTGLASYFLASLWYQHREKFPIRNLRRAMSAYRRVWFLDPAGRLGADPSLQDIPETDRARYRLLAMAEAEEEYEKSFLSERIPSGTWCGPDYGVNFLDNASPYLIAYLNYRLAAEERIDPAERISRIAKASRFLEVARGHVSDAPRDLLRQIDELARKIADLHSEIGSTSSAPAPASPSSVQKPLSAPPTPRTEYEEWSIQFEALYNKYGRAYAEKEIIVREGDTSREMFVILSGKVHVVKNYATPESEGPKLLSVLGEGAFFGEMSLLDGAPRFASVIAVKPTRVVALAPEALKAITRHYPDLALTIMATLVRRMRQYDRFVQDHLLPLAASQSGTQLNLKAELAGLLQEIEHP